MSVVTTVATVVTALVPEPLGPALENRRGGDPDPAQRTYEENPTKKNPRRSVAGAADGSVATLVLFVMTVREQPKGRSFWDSRLVPPSCGSAAGLRFRSHRGRNCC